MLDIADIENTISKLESGSTSYDNCLKLASLYIVRDYYNKEETHITPVEKEYNDILPSYNSYCDIKKQYQMNLLPKDSVLAAMQNLSKEIKEFLLIIYSSTDTQEERDMMKEQLDMALSEIRGTF